ncbi:hypothetical protein BS47DRAFT_1392411 [Hydnum rufescens UP504]|uniref:asparaginase n=1 Tax=Hydnum rufescens UP504 TaxID=1448309 RepID=A0A9P6DY13_9AGAM|nr:hypothetical protein BS47DRAFT_1392411 [Hydnum rufescens UP504]
MTKLTPMDSDTGARTILVIYTGGTIGMLSGEKGYQPEPHYLASALGNSRRFNDPTGDSHFSNSSSIAEWRTHRGTATPDGNRSPVGTRGSSSTLPVRSTRPVTLQDDISPSVQLGDGVYETFLPSLITPTSSTDKRIRYVVLEWQPIIDSSNMEFSDWIRLASEIELNYSFFDAFLILSGTDTICYTTSALSFLLEDLGKTVIVTGAQIPLSHLRNDAVDNLLGALSIAGRYIIPECCLYFNHTLYRGNRVFKHSSFDLDAFSSPNFPHLVDVGTQIVVNWRNILVPRAVRRFRAHKSMCPHVATLRLFPGITAASAHTFLSPPIQGVILQSFGAGNAPQRKDLMDVIKEACDRGIVVVAISQCSKGSVTATYAAGRSLADGGVVPGADMTPEAALTKLSYLLSKSELSTADVRKLMEIPLRGELTVPVGLSASVPSGLDGVQSVMAHLLRLSTNTPASSTYSSFGALQIEAPPSQSLTERAKDVTASWSLTASDAASTAIAILPYLIHLAASKDDIHALKFCIDAADTAAADPSIEASESGDPVSAIISRGGAAGIVNALDTARRAPLHTAALRGSVACTEVLLESGASVHLRDSLDHTSLYYAARQGHEDVAMLLVKAGANLAGADLSSAAKQMVSLDSAKDQLWVALLEQSESLG